MSEAAVGRGGDWVPNSQWQQFPRDEAETYGYGRLEIQIEDYDSVTESRTVAIMLGAFGYEGHTSGFYIDPNLDDGYTIKTQGVVSVPELGIERILAVVDDILKCGKLSEAFESPDEDSSCHE